MRRVDLRGTTIEVVAALSAWVRPPTTSRWWSRRPGSTGAPKRVVLSRRAVLASVAATTRRLGGEGRWLLALPASYVAGAQVVCRSVVAGEPPVLLDDHPSLAAAVEAGRPAYVSLVPTQLHRMLEDADDVARPPRAATVLLGVARSTRRSAAARPTRG